MKKSIITTLAVMACMNFAVMGAAYAVDGTGAYKAGDAEAAEGNFSVAIGPDAAVLGDSTGALSVGFDPKASGMGAVSIGNSTKALGTMTVAIGSTTKVHSKSDPAHKLDGSIAIGLAEIDSGMASIAIGTSSTITETNFAVAIGAGSNVSTLKKDGDGRTIVSSGAAGYKVIDYKEGKASVRQTRSDKAELIKRNGEAYGGVALGIRATSHDLGALALGMYSTAIGDGGVAVGRASTTLSDEATAIGTESVAHERRSMALGFWAEAKAESSVAIGSLSESTRAGGVIGKQAEGKFTTEEELYDYAGLSKADYTVLDEGITAKKAERKALVNTLDEMKDKHKADPTHAEVTAAETALNDWDTANKATLEENIAKKNEIRSKIITWRSTDGEVSIGLEGARTRQLTNLAAGTKATDAVNVAQLDSVMNLPVHFSQGGKMVNGQYVAGTEKAKLTLSSMHLDFGEGIKVEEVSTGTADKDNKRVLVSFDSSVLSKNESFVEMKHSIDRVKQDLKEVGAMSAALSGLGAVAAQAGASDQLLFSVGTYAGKEALAVGMTKRLKPAVVMSLGMSMGFSGSSDFMGNLGVSWKIGSGNVEQPDNAETEKLRREVNQLKNEMEEMKKMLLAMKK